MQSVYPRLESAILFLLVSLSFDAHAKDEGYELFTQNDEFYLKVEPTWLPIRGDIFVIIPIYETCDLLKLTKINNVWQTQTISYAQFTAANPTKVNDGRKYRVRS